MNSDLVSALELLKLGRSELVSRYAEEDSNLYGYSFKYMHSKVALDLAHTLLEHQWIDGQIQRSLELMQAGELSAQAQGYLHSALAKLSIFEEGRRLFEGYQEILSSKISSLRLMLETSDRADEKARRLTFDRHRDKVLFDREMQKYSRETHQ